MIEKYKEEADMLEKRSKELAQMISSEKDVYELHRLERRKYIIDTERYEILQDIRDMMEHIRKEEKYAQAV